MRKIQRSHSGSAASDPFAERRSVGVWWWSKEHKLTLITAKVHCCQSVKYTFQCHAVCLSVGAQYSQRSLFILGLFHLKTSAMLVCSAAC